MQALGKIAFAATFGAFFTRAYDFVRMGAISRADLRLCGSHAGVSIGEDGPSQMALEDLAMMRALHGSTVLYPADGNATVKLVDRHVRPARASPTSATTREATPVAVRRRTRRSRSAAARPSRRATDDASRWWAPASRCTSALAAAETLAAGGHRGRVIDCYSRQADRRGDAAHGARARPGSIVVVEDHRVEGGIGDAVLEALAATGPLSGRVREDRR